ncbi:MAG: MBL fold metallo-hydrolase, partial [Clostridia bacterium]|nr:MBL fold metallo-hydrolase [Clostridia bacterium]
MARRGEKKFNAGIAILLAVCCLVVGIAGGYFGLLEIQKPTESEVYSAGSLKVHFLELGNKYTGDCTYIKAGDTDILIDAGSRVDSIPTISAYLDQFVTDGKLEYVIVTHAHQDHYAGFATNIGVDSIFDLYECGIIIDFALTNQEQNDDKDGDGFGENMYSDYLRERSDEINNGAKHYTAAECIQTGGNVFEISDTATLTILNQKFYYEEAE